MPPLNSVLKLLRKLNCAEAELMVMLGVSRTLSLIPSWSGMKAALGAVSGVIVEVTHRRRHPGRDLSPPILRVEPGCHAIKVLA